MLDSATEGHQDRRRFGRPENWEALRAVEPDDAASLAGHLDVGPVVAFAGDWESDFLWAAQRIAEVAARGVTHLFHAGDFGIGSGKLGKRYLRTVERACVEHGVQVWVTPGNHENWERLWTKKLRARAPYEAAGALWWISEHVAALPRGHLLTLRTPAGTRRTLLSVGGAPSVDFDVRTPGVSWWPEELMTSDDVDHLLGRLGRHRGAGGDIDVMVSHDAPGDPYQTPKVAHICATNPIGFSQMALSYAAVGRHRITEVFEEARPRLVVHGHYHVADRAIVTLPPPHASTSRDTEQDRCQVVSLAGNKQAANLSFLDLDHMEMT